MQVAPTLDLAKGGLFYAPPSFHPSSCIETVLGITNHGLTHTRKTFIVPEIMFDPSLLLSPHTFLLAILCRHRAFDPDYLNDQPHRIGELRPVQAGKNKQELPLKDGMQDQ